MEETKKVKALADAPSAGVREFHSCREGAAALLGMRALMEDWAVHAKLILRLRTDSGSRKRADADLDDKDMSRTVSWGSEAKSAEENCGSP